MRTWITLFIFFSLALGAVAQRQEAVAQRPEAVAQMQGAVAPTPDERFVQLRDVYVAKLRPLEKAANLAWWEANTTGSDAAFKAREEADNKLAELHTDKAVFAELSRMFRQDLIKDPVHARELRAMYMAYLPRQADPKLTEQIIALEGEVEKLFNTHRSEVNGKRLTENDVRNILKQTKDSDEAKAAWTGYMAVGRTVAPKLNRLVKLRNEMARKLGYRDFFAMTLDEQELQEDELFAIFDELDRLTREPFAQLKGEIDEHMQQRFGLDKKDLRPWHTDDLFFQEAPNLARVSLDDIYKGKDPVKLSQKAYESMGMKVEDIIARSSLYEHEGKSPHAFCTNIDRYNDIRVLANVRPNADWMDTMHHELGHGVYETYIGPDVPYLLRQPAHVLTTEGMAMMFGATTKNPDFLDKVVGLQGPDAQAYRDEARRVLRSEKLIFSRWTQVMLRFEKAMYEDPDQDLNKLWWDLKAKYQLLNPPDDLSGADYAAKLHIVAAPCYYHNYMLGDLFASQVWDYAARQVSGIEDPTSTSFAGNAKAGAYFREQIFAPGNLYSWRELTERATGRPLSARSYAEFYVK
jgi:peptidyl-dipeptidase A